MMMNKYIGTFGSGHLGGLGLNYHVEIIAPDSMTARLILNAAFDGKWSGIYEESFDYPTKYHTTRLGILEFTSMEPGIDEVPYYNSRLND